MSIDSLRAVSVFFLSFFVVSVQSDPAFVPQPVREKLIMGWLESIFLRPWNLRVTAKLDTGAKTSSLHADHISHFTKEGEEWVRFTLDNEEKSPVVVERPLVRTAYIKEHDSRSSKRDVVTMKLCKNGKEYETEFTLGDRSNFNYPVLLGRNFLQEVAIVDAAHTFLYKAENDPCTLPPSSPSDLKHIK